MQNYSARSRKLSVMLRSNMRDTYVYVFTYVRTGRDGRDKAHIIIQSLADARQTTVAHFGMSGNFDAETSCVQNFP